jgi:hypothetical protein
VIRWSTLAFCGLAGCGPVPPDPLDTFERVSQGTLRVGVSRTPALDLVIGGLCQDSPWKEHVAFSLPYVRETEGGGCARVFAMPPGENRWAVYIDSWLATREP